MSVTKSASVWYRLYAVLVHNGQTTNSGHYYCYVRAPGGTWHCMNDSSVSNVAFSVRYYKSVSIYFLRIDPLRFQARCRKRRLNLALGFGVYFGYNTFLLIGECMLLLCWV